MRSPVMPRGGGGDRTPMRCFAQGQIDIDNGGRAEGIPTPGRIKA